VPIAPGSKLRVTYKLYDDDAFKQPTSGPGSSGELAFEFAGGVAGRAIESLFFEDTPGTKYQAQFRDEIAQGLREHMPAHRAGAWICAELALVEVGSPPAEWNRACPAELTWQCRIGPRSNDNDGNAGKTCGCMPTRCPFPLVEWYGRGEGAWPDGTAKATIDCIDDRERIRRSKLAG
jgi:hypothetical protein